ncbi:DNA phosphorothioation-dependent restriction protein DptH [Clostridium hydrogeniformans]|uniref:DNA phosphorothioation-dependent restriction protein DptH n=1 Tax=Clostridium hydrogeniformans TaxID=349933 RepID=UPI0004836EB9|nr:DNA phosphorothioation-dependent restriction protein DptH [Clostridium hydrogeniformans]
MLDQFYNFLAKKVVEYFDGTRIYYGDRYEIQFEKESDVKHLYEEIKNISDSKLFKYQVNEKYEEYTTYSIKFNDIILIVAATIDGVNPDFLATLRNEVSTNMKSQFKNSAILFIHTSNKDTITDGGINFQKEGMPFHSKTLINDINYLIDTSNLALSAKYVLKFDLRRREREDSDEGQSILQYSDIVSIINKGYIDDSEFKEFELFRDPKLDTINDEKEAISRLNENSQAYLKIDNIHKYGGDIDSNLEKFLDETGKKKLANKDWFNEEYKVVRQSMDNYDEKDIIYEGSSIENISKEDYWEKEEGPTKAQRRKRSIIVFNKDKVDNIKLSFAFDNKLEAIKDKGVKCDFGKNVSAKINNRKINVTLEDLEEKVSFYKVSYSGKSNYEFKIVVIPMDKAIFEDTVVRTNYTIKIAKKEQNITLTTSDSEFTLNPYGEDTSSITLNFQDENVPINAINKFKVKNKIKIDENEDAYRFNLMLDNLIIPVNIVGSNSKITRISGRQIWINKLRDKGSYKFLDNKIIKDENVNFAYDEFKVNLDREEFILKNGGMAFVESNGKLKVRELKVCDKLKEAYNRILEYYKSNVVLPSLAYIDEDLAERLKTYIDIYYSKLEKIKYNDNMCDEFVDLLRVGTIEGMGSSRQILLTPLHPINVSYQLMITEELKDKVISDEEDLEKEIANKLDSTNLIPYISFGGEKLYRSVEQNHSKEWKQYVINDIDFNERNRGFVKKLVREKINEFIKHFKTLFLSTELPLRINLINTGYSKDILQGIIDYYNEELKSKGIEKLRPLIINIYNKSGDSVFEELQNYVHVDEAEEKLGLSFAIKSSNKKYSKDDIFDIVNSKLSYYIKNYDTTKYEYSHITFYEMEHEFSNKNTIMDNINTGVSLGGLLSSVPSKEISKSYRTGYGTKFIYSKNTLIKMATKMNALICSAENESPFDDSRCKTTAIDEYKEDQLNRIYESANWVTFINPMVGLQFFKDTIEEKDLLIIHYSDQYTPSSGYDSITVTKKTKQYKEVIKSFLENKNVLLGNDDELITKVISCFNAINGDWLLKIISCNGYEDREKLSIVSTIKLSLSYFYNENIVWVPISLEEILRISKGCGLSSKEGLFSVKNLSGDGAYSDDLLLVGIECCADGNIDVHYYPIEVKIGQVKGDVTKKAKLQAYKTRNHIERNISKEINDKLQAKIFRDFLIKLVLVSIEKLKLYNVWDEQNWDSIIETDVRTKLLNDDYRISNSLDEIIGRGAIFTFKSDISFEKNGELVSIGVDELGDAFNQEEYDKGNKILELVFPEASGYRNILRSVEEIKNNFILDKSDIKSDTLLYNLYEGRVCEMKEETSINDNSNDEKSSAIYSENSGEDIVAVAETKDPLSVLFGRDIHRDCEVIWNPTDSIQNNHTNTGIIGTMGTGKTQFTKSLIYQLNKNTYQNIDGKKIGLLIFDYKGDYIDNEFVEATNAKVYETYHLPFNPLELVQGNKEKNLLPLYTANALKHTMTTAFGLGVVQENKLKELIMNAYDKRGIKKNDPNTWTKKPPTIAEVCREFFDDEDVKQDKLFTCLDKLYDFEIFDPDVDNSKSLYDMIDGVTVINLSDSDSDIQNLVVGIILDIFYSQMKVLGESKLDDKYRQLSKMILVDEADNFLCENFQSLKKILKEGRMFGVGTILSTQLLSHFSTGDNEYANYILTWIVHKVSDLSIKDIKFIYNTTNKTQEDELFTKIKSLEKHKSLVKLGNVEDVIYMEDNAFWMEMQKNK